MLIALVGAQGGAIQTVSALFMLRTIDPREERTTDQAADTKFQPYIVLKSSS